MVQKLLELIATILTPETLRQLLLTALSIGAVPTLESSVNTIKSLFKWATKTDMPAVLVTMMSIAIAYIAQSIYSVFVTGIDPSAVTGLALGMAGLTSLYHGKQTKLAVLKTNASNPEITPVVQNVTTTVNPDNTNVEETFPPIENTVDQDLTSTAL